MSMHPKRFIISALTLTVVLTAPPVVAQTTNEDLQKQITALEQRQKAILKELRELKQLLRNRAVAPAGTMPSSVSISRQPSQGSPQNGQW